MIVDDDQTMVKLLRTLLELDGYEVVHTASGSTVVPMTRSERPDVLLMDVHLADADGFDLLRQMRADAALASQKVIMTSGLDFGAKCIETGADSFLQKPYSPDQLSARIRELLN